MTRKMLLFSTIGALFIACGNENISKVKNSTFGRYDSMTISAAIEGSNICKSVDYEDISKDGLRSVKITCTEVPQRAKERYDKALAEYNKSLDSHIDMFKKSINGQISDDEIKSAAQKFVTAESDPAKMFDQKFDDKGFGEFMKANNLSYKNKGGFGWGFNPLISVANQLIREPKLPNSVIYEMTFIIKPDEKVEPKKDGFFIITDEKKEKNFGFINDFYER